MGGVSGGEKRRRVSSCLILTLFGQHRVIPVHETVDAAEALKDLGPRTKQQVRGGVGVHPFYG